MRDKEEWEKLEKQEEENRWNGVFTFSPKQFEERKNRHVWIVEPDES